MGNAISILLTHYKEFYQIVNEPVKKPLANKKIRRKTIVISLKNT